jgi:hypothetical protein
MLRLIGLAVSLLAGLTACRQPVAGPAGTQIETDHARGYASQAPLESLYLLTARGDYVLSSPPPGVEVSLGSKVLRRVGWADAAEAPGTASIDGSN